jgi:hypothetical protein
VGEESEEKAEVGDMVCHPPTRNHKFTNPPHLSLSQYNRIVVIHGLEHSRDVVARILFPSCKLVINVSRMSSRCSILLFQLQPSHDIVAGLSLASCKVVVTVFQTCSSCFIVIF